MYELPITIEINDIILHIRNKGDYRMVLDCFNAINDKELATNEKIIAALIIFFEDFNCVEDVNNFTYWKEAFDKMQLFFNCGQEEIGMQSKYNLIDWEKDSPLISSAINNVAKTEIRSVEYCHWWTFMGYYLAIGESPLSTIVNIRHKLAKGDKLEKYEQRFRTENPQYFIGDYRNSSDKEIQDWFLNEVWNK